MHVIRVIKALWHWVTLMHVGYSRETCSQAYIIAFGQMPPGCERFSSWHILHSPCNTQYVFLFYTGRVLFFCICIVFFSCFFLSELSCTTFPIGLGCIQSMCFFSKALNHFRSMYLYNYSYLMTNLKIVSGWLPWQHNGFVNQRNWWYHVAMN